MRGICDASRCLCVSNERTKPGSRRLSLSAIFGISFSEDAATVSLNARGLPDDKIALVREGLRPSSFPFKKQP